VIKVELPEQGYGDTPPDHVGRLPPAPTPAPVTHKKPPRHEKDTVKLKPPSDIKIDRGLDILNPI